MLFRSNPLRLLWLRFTSVTFEADRSWAAVIACAGLVFRRSALFRLAEVKSVLFRLAELRLIPMPFMEFKFAELRLVLFRSNPLRLFWLRFIPVIFEADRSWAAVIACAELVFRRSALFRLAEVKLVLLRLAKVKLVLFRLAEVKSVLFRLAE